MPIVGFAPARIDILAASKFSVRYEAPEFDCFVVYSACPFFLFGNHEIMNVLYLLLSLVLLNLIYITVFFATALWLRVSASHYFLGYDPKLFSFRVRDVQFSIGLYIPVIGLARIHTVVNGEKQRFQYPWEFTDRPVWRRLIVTWSGVCALVVTGVLIFSGIAYVVKDRIITKEEVNRHGIYPSKLAMEAGFQQGDRVLAVNGKDYDDFYDLVSPGILLHSRSYTVERDGRQVEIKSRPLDSPEQMQELYLMLLVPFEVDKVDPNSPAAVAGIEPGDRITKVNGAPVIKFHDMVERFRKDEDGSVTLEIARHRGNTTEVLEKTLSLDDMRRAGIFPRELINYTEQHVTLPEALAIGTRRAYAYLEMQVRIFVRVFLWEHVYKNKLSGPIGITQITEYFFWQTAGIYALIALLWNALPLPKSLFWETMPLLYEGLTRRKYSYPVFRRSLTVGWIVLISVWIWIFVQDIGRFF
jgi:regulator of sigma E protease